MNYNREPKILDVLGTYTVLRSYTNRKLYEYAAAFDDILIEPQISPIEIIQDDNHRYIRVILNGKVTNSWMQEYIGKEKSYWITDTSTWSFANKIQNGIFDKNGKLAEIFLSKNYKIIHHHDENNNPAYYHDGTKMIRIVKNDNSPIAISKSYWYENKMCYEPML